MKSKWHRFHTSTTPIKLGINQSGNNQIEDFNRADWDNTFIDRRPLRLIMADYNVTKGNGKASNLTIAVLEQIINNVILKKVSDENKTAALAYLKKTMHQGGVLNPATAALTTLMYKMVDDSLPETSTDRSYSIMAAGFSNTMQVNIQTTGEGFILQEIATTKEYITSQQKFRDNSRIIPDPGQEFCTKAQATIKVTFDNSNPKVELLNSNISYGSETIRLLADSRNWLERFIDILKNIFGLNDAEDLSYSDPEQPSGPSIKA